jgi:chromosome partitioning protein
VNLARPVRIMGIVLNMEDHTRVSAEVLELLEERFGTLVLATTLPKAVKLEEAHSKSQSIFEHAASSQAAHAFEKLVKEIQHRGHLGARPPGP